MPWGMGAVPGMGGYPPWVMPPGMQQPPYGAQQQQAYGQPSTGFSGGLSPPSSGGEQQQPPLPASAPTAAASGGWSEHQTPGGFKYYYHPATGTSSWDPPADMQGQNAPAAQPTGVGSLPMSAPPNMPNVSQLASSLSAMSVGSGQQTSSAAAPIQQVPQQPAYLPTSAAPPSSAPINGYPASGANSNAAASGQMSGFQEAICNGCGYSPAANSAGVLGGGGLGGLGMPTGGVSELGGVPMQGSSALGNAPALAGLSLLSGNSMDLNGAAGGGVVLVHDLPDHFTSQELSTAFAQFGKVSFCELGEGNSGRVGYESSRDANNAVATMDGLPVGEKKLLVSLASLPC
eukprot:Transcript_8722.p1 GENE.Transcript_8722~~Transcript_8722.p1  ORF type:complete len:346 (-),score=14.97 Transcript_8722:142-1179(-)